MVMESVMGILSWTKRYLRVKLTSVQVFVQTYVGRKRIMSMIDFIDEHYDDTFAATYRLLEEMVRTKPDEAQAHIRRTLTSLYVRQGNDWTGRGAAGNAGMDATIAAHEAFLAELNSSRRGERP